MNKEKINNLIYVLIFVGIVGYGVYYIKTAPKIQEADIISRSGMHIHPSIIIKIKGEKQEVTANIGIGAIGGMKGVHTHDTTGVLHYEQSGIAIKEDTKFKRFFEIWGRTFNSNCIFDKCNGPEGKVRMTVQNKEDAKNNIAPKENFDFENYLVLDGDQIEISFE
jgi:hypothetical protein